MATEGQSDAGLLTKLRIVSLVALGFTIRLVIRVFYILKWLITTSLRAFVFLAIALLYAITLPVPFLGQKLLDINRKLTLFELDGDNPLDTFRTDMMAIMVQQHRPDYTRKRRVLRSKIELEYLKAKKKHELGELTVSIWGSILAIGLSYYQLWPMLSLIVSGYVVMMTVSILVRIVILEVLAFDENDVEGEHGLDKLELMLGWNQVILNSISSQLSILLLAVLGMIHTSAYDIAKDILQKYYVDNFSKWELLQYLLDSLWG